MENHAKANGTGQVDITISNHGTVHLFHCHTERTLQWFEQKTDCQWWGSAAVVEHRYALDIYHVLTKEFGFIIEA